MSYISRLKPLKFRQRLKRGLAPYSDAVVFDKVLGKRFDVCSLAVERMYDSVMLFSPPQTHDAAEDLRTFVNGRRYGTILADPPWQFQNRTGKVAPEYKRLSRYDTLSLQQIKALPVVHATGSAKAGTITPKDSAP